MREYTVACHSGRLQLRIEHGVDERIVFEEIGRTDNRDEPGSYTTRTHSEMTLVRGELHIRRSCVHQLESTDSPIPIFRKLE